MTPNRRTFLTQLSLSAAGLGLVSFVPSCRTAAPMVSAVRPPRSTPEAEGLSSASILAFVEAAQAKHEMHGFVLVRHGRVVQE